MFGVTFYKPFEKLLATAKPPRDKQCAEYH